MARSTLTLLFALTAISFLLLGVNIGKKFPSAPQVLSSQDALPSPTWAPPITSTVTPRPTKPIPSIAKKPTTGNPSTMEGTGRYPHTLRTSPQPATNTGTSLRTVNGVTIFTDHSCGISISFPGSYVRQRTENADSKIFTNPDNPHELIAVACQDAIPQPPVSEEQIVAVTLSGVDATLYHDQNPDGSPRDEIIARHPTQNHDVIIAGWGDAFQQAVASFTFLR